MVKATGRPPITSKEAILDAALEAFATHGFDGTSIRVLNRQLGTSHNAIHQRFGTKEALWYAAIDHGFQILLDALLTHVNERGEDPNRDTVQVLRSILVTFLRVSAEHPHLLMIMNKEGVQPSIRLDYIYKTYLHPVLQASRDMLKGLEDAKRIRPLPFRSLFFLIAHGGSAPFSLKGLQSKLDDVVPEVSSEEHIQWLGDILVSAIVIDPHQSDLPPQP